MNTLVLTTDDILSAIQRFDGVRLAKRTLAQWATAGVVVPSIAWRKVRRAPRLYSYADLGRARLVVRLTRQLGMTLQDARDVLAALDASDNPLHDLLRPANAVKAKTMQAVCVMRSGKWCAAIAQVGDTDYTLTSGEGQRRFEFGSADEFRFPLSSIVKDYPAIEREKVRRVRGRSSRHLRLPTPAGPFLGARSEAGRALAMFRTFSEARRPSVRRR